MSLMLLKHILFGTCHSFQNINIEETIVRKAGGRGSHPHVVGGFGADMFWNNSHESQSISSRVRFITAGFITMAITWRPPYPHLKRHHTSHGARRQMSKSMGSRTTRRKRPRQHQNHRLQNRRWQALCHQRQQPPISRCNQP